MPTHTPIVWNLTNVAEYISRHGASYARVKTPRGWPARLKKQYKCSSLLGSCFRNALFTALNSNDSLYYCEGYARTRTSGWTPHGWCVYKDNTDDPNWAIDLTWPWIYKGRQLDNIHYAGVCFEPHIALDFIKSVERNGYGNSLSVFKHVDHLPYFLNGLS